MIVIGVDAHKDSHTAVAVNAGTAIKLAETTVPARDHGHQELLQWAGGLDVERVWAIEDCRHVSGRLERALLEHGEHVVRVPPKMMANERKSARTPGKSDSIDALAIARVAVREPDLPLATVAGDEREIALLVDLRDDFVTDAKRHSSRLRWLLHDLDPDLQPALRSLSNARSRTLLNAALSRMPPSTIVRVCQDLLELLTDLYTRADQLRRELAALVKTRAPQLTEIPGCGVLTAAKILAEVGQIQRFRTDAQLARYGGVAPLEASSGRSQRHRLSRQGNRQLNYALHIIAVTQVRVHPPAKEYVTRRTANGESTREAIRALKRHLARRIFNALREPPRPTTLT